MSEQKFMTPAQAIYALNKAGKYHRGDIELPDDIVKLRKLIAEKTRNAELFLLKLRVVDEGMIREIVQLKLNLDVLYSRWSLE